MPILTSREVVLVKEEVTYNVDPTPTAVADAVLVGNASWSHEGLRMVERNVVQNVNGSLKQVFGGTLKTVSFDVELKGSGTIDVAPDFGVLFEACGMVETVIPLTLVGYLPTSVKANYKSVTIYYYQDGKLNILTGCRGTWTANLETGNVGMVTFTMTGHSGAPTDAALPDPTLDATEPYVIRGGAMTIGGYAATINSIAIDFGQQIITPPDMNSADGYGEITFGKRDSNGSFDPEDELVATKDFYTEFTSNASLILTTDFIGVDEGNKFQFYQPAVSYRDVSPGDRDGIRTYEIPFGAHDSLGDDAIGITFT